MSRTADDIRITITDLRRHIHRVTREVERGATFTIVRRGRAVARLVPLASLLTFDSGLPDLAARADDYLEGFGER